MSGPITAEAATTVRVLLFSALREAVGAHELIVAVPDPASGNDLLNELQRVHPVVTRFRSVVRLAVNASYVPLEAQLHSGDEVALITPVSGG